MYVAYHDSFMGLAVYFCCCLVGDISVTKNSRALCCYQQFCLKSLGFADKVGDKQRYFFSIYYCKRMWNWISSRVTLDELLLTWVFLFDDLQTFPILDLSRKRMILAIRMDACGRDSWVNCSSANKFSQWWNYGGAHLWGKIHVPNMASPRTCVVLRIVYTKTHKWVKNKEN